MSMDVLRYEPLFSLFLDLGYDRAHKIGTVPLGWRGIYPVSGGRFALVRELHTGSGSDHIASI